MSLRQSLMKRLKTYCYDKAMDIVILAMHMDTKILSVGKRITLEEVELKEV